MYADCIAESQLKWQVHLGVDGKPVDASSGSSSYRVIVSDELMNKLHFRGMGTHNVSWINALVHSATTMVSITNSVYTEELY